MEADVFKQHNLAVLERRSKFLCAFANNVLCHFYVLTEQLAESFCNGSKRKFGLELALGSAEVRAEDNLCAVVKEVFNGRERGNDSLIAGNNAVFHFYVEVAADKDFFSFNVDIFN